MSAPSKHLSTGQATTSTGGFGAVLSVLVGSIFPESSSEWRSFAYAVVPGIAAVITYLMSWVISRHGLESPEDAGKRAKCKRDLKEIDNLLKSGGLTPEIEEKLKKSKERTIEILVSIGTGSVMNTVQNNETNNNTDQ
ncbi:hypothetical protein [Dickeya fangzhongdai]|uniref:hypothetical protein n=1 Tax=Dickeya fangzhongdai TaxID=1778540 RepID=UPI001ADB28B5|nr:hypothetical protein [Dickeya fangzhongdai]MBO8132474.1 hypothetical protein [Dickeya fangzhongdai]